jgi:hypothetical protein
MTAAAEGEAMKALEAEWEKPRKLRMPEEKAGRASKADRREMETKI